MATKALFKRCSQCSTKMTHTNEHDLCPMCLGEGHNVTVCKMCQKFTPKAKHERSQRLKAALWEKVLAEESKGKTQSGKEHLSESTLKATFESQIRTVLQVDPMLGSDWEETKISKASHGSKGFMGTAVPAMKSKKKKAPGLVDFDSSLSFPTA